MKLFVSHAYGVLLVLSFVSCNALGQQSGGGYILTPTVVSSGGSSSSQGSYSLNGTIGQAAAGVFARTPPYTTTGGFWAATLLSTPTASPGSISGRIVTTQGLPLGGVIVVLGGTSSAITITDGEGYYSFENVETGGFYTLTVERVNFAFVPSTISFSQLGEHTEAIFNAVAIAPTGNPLDTAMFFVRQHYLDFLGREPDANGLIFWTNQIASCGLDQSCVEFKRINVSAAFFLSIEFRETGYFLYRAYKTAYGNIPDSPVPIKYDEFLQDKQQLGHALVVGAPGWQQRLEDNKRTFAASFIERPRFIASYPTTMTPAAFVAALYENAGVTPSAEELAAALDEFGESLTTSDSAARARVLRRVTENTVLVRQEFNRAFVLMQYFGYLRRNPNDEPEPGLNFDGYNFWLNKLNQFNGNFINAEMVKAFIVSPEYRQKFVP